MPGKKKRHKQPTLRSRIVSLIQERGPMKVRDMARILPGRYQSINTEVLELQRLGGLRKDSQGIWSLVPGVSSATLGIQPAPSYQPGDGPRTGVSTEPMPPPPQRSRGQQDDFMDRLTILGVKKGVDAIAGIFFSGNIYDMRWLHRVLSQMAQGFVAEDQCKLMMGWWAATRGIPYNHRDFFKN